MKKDVDYTLYLVTDSTPQILGDRDIVKVVDDAVSGGVTIVQYRDKQSDTGDLIKTARALQAVTKRHGVPFIINDRVDVALAIGADGVHIGQDDMDLATARRLLGPEAIIGVTVSSAEEAHIAARGGADYLGIGTVFSTQTKVDTKSIIGITGLRAILYHLLMIPGPDSEIPTVCIGSINASNAQRVLYQSQASTTAPQGTARKSLSGIAVVSALMAASDPKAAASSLRRLIVTPHSFTRSLGPTASSRSLSHILGEIGPTFKALIATKPLCHNMTNTVVQNFAANICLALGGSPIMSQNPAEAADLAAIPGASLVINMGTATADGLAAYKTALGAYNAAGRPVLLDPVGGGATAVRRNAVRTLLESGYFTVIKGNEAEIRTVWAQGQGVHALGAGTAEAVDEVRQHGVDSGASGFSGSQRAALVRDLARRERNVAVMTGAVDYLSDGTRTLAVSNGHALLGDITGSGCSLGAVIAAFLAADAAGGSDGEDCDALRAALAGLLVYEIAAERAAKGLQEKGGRPGPGSFIMAFLDAIRFLHEEAAGGEYSWLQAAKVEEVALE